MNRIESLVVRQAVAESPVGEERTYAQETSAVDVGDLVLTLAESHPQDWYAWHHDFVVKGNNGPPFEKSGKLEYLAPNQKDVVVELGFNGLGIHRLASEPQGGEGVSRVRASMYCGSHVRHPVGVGVDDGQGDLDQRQRSFPASQRRRAGGSSSPVAG